MPEPTTVPSPSALPTVEIELFGETHTLRYGFRAYQELGLNPYDPASIAEYRDKKFTPLELARQLWAGILHEYHGRRATRKGEKPPTVEDVMDELDPIKYVELWVHIQIAMGVDDESRQAEGEQGEPKEPAANPQKA